MRNGSITGSANRSGKPDWFHLLFESASEALAILNPETGLVLHANKRLALLLGHPDPESMVDRPPLPAVGSGEPIRAFPALVDSSGTAEPKRLEWQSPAADESPRVFEIIISDLPDGDQPMVLTRWRDVTREKSREAELALSETRWRRVFEQIPLSMQLFAPDGTTRRINRAYEELFQLNIDDLRGFNILQDQQLADAGLRQSVEAAFAGKVSTIAPIPFELRTRPDQPTRGTRWIGSTMFPVLEHDGRILEVVCVHHDHSASIEAENEIQRLNQSLEERIAERTAELQMSEERFKKLFEFSPLGIARVNGEGKFQQANPAFAELVGYTPEELSSMTYWDLTPPDYHPDQTTSIATLNQTGRFGPFEKEYLHRDGRHVPVMLNGMRVTSSTGEVQIWGLAEDISHRREAESALRESEEKFKALFQLSPLGMARVSWDGRFLEVNPSFARMIGYEPEEVLELSYWDVTPRKYEEAEKEILETVVRTGRFGPFEKEYIHKDGHRVPIVLNGMLIRSKDGGDELWGIAEDITERTLAQQSLRDSERKFRVLFESSGQGVMIHDENELFSEVNPAAARLFGLNPEDLIGKHPSEFAPQYQPDGELSSVAARRHIAACIEYGSTRFEWHHLHSAGYVFMLEVILTRIKDGEKDLVQAIVTDISERKRAEQELKNALERERELNQLKSNFVSMVSHEFRTPLGIIQSSAEILDDYLEQLAPEERAEQLRSIIKNSRRMAGLMEDVLLLGRLDAGKLEFIPRPIDLASLCRRLVDEVLSTTDGRCRIEFSTENLPTEAHADERLLRHVLINLLTNAVKYSERGQAVVFKSIGTPGGVRFSIKDRGIGIPAGEESTLFTAFQRGSNVGQRPGTGLGLVIVKQSIDLHGGSIRLSRRPRGGTSFVVDIPCELPKS